jgi:ParB family chromosome partitioning protein
VAKKKGLGKGLGALIGNDADRTRALHQQEEVREKLATAPVSEGPVPLEDGSLLLLVDPRDLKPNPKQPRTHFDEEALHELSESIKKDGLQEPIIIRPAADGYELVSGERRVRASIMADVDKVPAVCREISDRDMLKFGLIENIQREDLSPIEVADAYHGLIEQFGWTQEQLADEVGKSRVSVTNTLRLLRLPDVVQEQIADGSLSMGHAKALLGLESPEAQAALARKIIADGLSVRQTEQFVSRKRQPPKKKAAAEKDPNLEKIEDTLRRRLGTRVNVKSSSPQRGRIEIEYFSLDEFERLLELLQGR